MNIIIYPSHFELMQILTNEQAGMLIKAIGEYRNGTYPELTDNLVKGIFISIKRDFDLQAENYNKIVERNRLNGKSGGRPKTQPNPINPMGILETQPNPKNLKDKDKDKDKDIEKDKDKDKDIEKDKDKVAVNNTALVEKFDNLFSDIK